MNDIKISSTGNLSSKKLLEERDKKLKKACKAFEAVFTYEMLKTMRKTVNKSDLLHHGQAEDIYNSMLDQQLAKEMAAEGGKNSISNLLYQQLKKDE